MANAGKQMGAGAQGKGDGTGGMTNIDDAKVGPNDALSNRDKKQHSSARGQDGKAIQSDQGQDHAANRRS